MVCSRITPETWMGTVVPLSTISIRSCCAAVPLPPLTVTAWPPASFLAPKQLLSCFACLPCHSLRKACMMTPRYKNSNVTYAGVINSEHVLHCQTLGSAPFALFSACSYPAYPVESCSATLVLIMQQSLTRGHGIAFSTALSAEQPHLDDGSIEEICKASVQFAGQKTQAPDGHNSPCNAWHACSDTHCRLVNSHGLSRL